MEKKIEEIEIKQENGIWSKWHLIATIIILILTFLLLSDIRINLIRSHKEFNYVSYIEEPKPFEKKPRNVSPLYFYELVYLGEDSIRHGSNLRFSLILKNKGKKSIINPEYRIYIVDAIGDLRGSFPKYNTTNGQRNENIGYVDDGIKKNSIGTKVKFSFNMPPVDQKVIGDWKIFVYLYDGSSGDLISYLVQKFEVTDEVISPIVNKLVSLILIAIPIIMIFSLFHRIQEIIKRIVDTIRKILDTFIEFAKEMGKKS